MKEHVVSGFNASRTVILTSKINDGREKVFEDAELEALLEQDSCQNQEELARSLAVTQHFKTPQSHDSEARKLGAVRIEAEKC